MKNYYISLGFLSLVCLNQYLLSYLTALQLSYVFDLQMLIFLIIFVAQIFKVKKPEDES